MVSVHFYLRLAAYRTSVSQIRHVVGLSLFSLVAVVQQKPSQIQEEKRGSGLFHTALPGALITAAHISKLLGKTVLCLLLLHKKKPGRSYAQSVRTVKKTLYLTIYVNARVLIAFLSVTYERIVMW